MNARKTIVIAVLFLIILGIYIWDQRRVEDKAQQEKIAGRLVTPEREDLTRITIKRENETIVLRKEGEHWRITEPIESPTDESNINLLVGQVATAERKESFPVGAERLAEFGLDDPVVTAEIEAAGESYTRELVLGDTTTDNLEVYVRADDGNEVITTAVALKNQLTKPLLELRDKRTIPANLNETTTLTLAYDGQTLRLEKRNDNWDMVEPMRQAADKDLISKILREWNNARAADFIDTATLQLEQYGLNEPVLVGSVYVPDDTQASSGTLLVGSPLAENAERRWARLESDPDTVFSIENKLLDSLRPDPQNLRAKELFALTADEVQRAIFDVRGNIFDLRKNPEDKWYLANEPETPLDQSMVSVKIRDLLALKAQRFFDEDLPTSDTHLDDPNLRVTVSGRNGTTTETLITGRKPEDQDFVYAQLIERHQLLGLPWTEPGKFFLMRDEIVDKSLFSYDIQAVARIEIQDTDKRFVLVRENNRWQVTPEGGESRQLEPQPVEALLDAMNALEWERRLDPGLATNAQIIEEQSLREPTRQITLLDAEGAALARLGQGGETEQTVYVRRGAGDYFGIDKLDLQPVVDALEELFAAYENAG